MQPLAFSLRVQRLDVGHAERNAGKPPDQALRPRFGVGLLDDQQRARVEHQHGRFQRHRLQSQQVGIEGAGGGDVLDEQADGRDFHELFFDSMPKKIMLPSKSATSKSRRP